MIQEWEKNDLAFLTKGSRYNSIFISDVDGEFALSVPNNSFLQQQ